MKCAERRALATVRAVMSREARGPRGGAPKGQPLLKDDPIVLNQPAPSGKAHAEGTIFTGGHRNPDTRAFPG